MKNKMRFFVVAVLLLVPALAFAQYTSADQILSTTESTLKTLSNTIINVISIVMGLAGIGMLAVNLVKYLRGEQGSNDALTKVGAGLLIAVVLLQIIKLTLLGG